MLIFPIWLLLRVITSLIAATASTIRPFTDIESHIPLWPPSAPISDWFTRIMISPWDRWDVAWYTKIITEGYQSGNGTTNFHPLYPLIAKLFLSLKINPVFCLLIVSSVATLVLLHIYKKLTTLDLNGEKSNLSIPIFLLYPISFILFAPYPESLFLLFTVSCFYWIRKRNWLIAGLSAFLAVLTRQQGLFLIFPLIWELWEATGQNLKGVKFYWLSWLNIGWIPLAYLLWIGYRFLVINDGYIRYADFQDAIYSIFLSSSATEVVPHQKFMLPWNALYLGIEKLLHSPDIDIWTNIILAAIFFILLIIGWKNLRISYKIYTLFISFISISYHTGSTHPYMGLPRHLYIAFPVFLGITPIISQKRYIYFLYILLGFIFMAFLIVEYTLTAWVP